MKKNIKLFAFLVLILILFFVLIYFLNNKSAPISKIKIKNSDISCQSDKDCAIGITLDPEEHPFKTPCPTTRTLIRQFHQITKSFCEARTFYSPLGTLIFSMLSSKNLLHPPGEIKNNLNNDKYFLY